MRCPHCLDSFHDNPKHIDLGEDVGGDWAIISRTCPSCKKYIFILQSGKIVASLHGRSFTKISSTTFVYPKTASRPPVPTDVPEEFSVDYVEACLVIADSPKASAALSRRSLQHILREKAGVKKSNLASEIQEVIDGNQLPSFLAESIDAVRNIGNFAAHPIKCQSIGEIVEVEPGEAIWNLDVIESLFDFYFVQPEVIKKKRKVLNIKLKDAGKPEMK
jgi:hypothetical protein